MDNTYEVPVIVQRGLTRQLLNYEILLLPAHISTAAVKVEYDFRLCNESLLVTSLFALNFAQHPYANTYTHASNLGTNRN